MNGSTVRVNGRVVAVPRDDTRLLDWLRHELGLTGPKEGCGAGHCGACTVVVDGRPVLSCCTILALVVDAEVSTVEGIVRGALGARLAEAFLAHGALQCGYCTPGMLTTAFAVLSGARHPLSEGEVRAALSGNICRCTGYGPIVDAVLAAQDADASGPSDRGHRHTLRTGDDEHPPMRS